MKKGLKKGIVLTLGAVMMIGLAGCGAMKTETQARAADTVTAESSADAGKTGTAPGHDAGNTGTAPNNNDPGNKNATHQVKDALGREVTVKNDVERVVVTFNLEEYLAVTGEEGINKLVGFSHAYWQGRREDAWNTYTKKFPQLKEIPDVGYNDSISVEAILALKPDLLIMSSAVNYDFIEPYLGRLEEAGIPVLFVNYHAQTIDMHRASTEAIGNAMGREQRGVEIADFYEKQMKIVEDRIASIPQDAKKPKVYMEFSRGVNEYGNSWGKKMWGALIGECGGQNIAGDFGEGNSVDVNPELVIAANPDVIVFTASPQTDISDNIVLGYGADKDKALAALGAYENREGWSSLNAVKNRKMAAVYHDLSRHIFDFAGAQMLAKAIHPELFRDIDPEAGLQEFFDKYMPVKLDGAWMVSQEQ